MTTMQEQFDGKYNATLETNYNGEGGTGVWISYKQGKREYTASLGCLMDTGELTDAQGYVHDVETAVIDDIEAWAVENGY